MEKDKTETTQEKESPIITRRLLDWYEKQGRDLPWRATSDPYKIWISEIILQQTRVAQGKDYYHRFVERFPNIHALALAEEEEVLKLWQGLGYYTRARNLHAAAKQIVTTFNGVFPEDYKSIISLKGIGEYTAAAIASIAFNKPYAVVDGNVFRVITRIFSIDLSIHTSAAKKLITEISQSLLDQRKPGKYNQAIMDFGALICTPTQPKCMECTLQVHCKAFSEKRVGELPVNSRKIAIKKRYFHYFHIQNHHNTFLQKRTKKDIWKNLFEFPLVETTTPVDFIELKETEGFKALFREVPILSVTHRLSIKHQLTHQTIYARFYHIIIPDNVGFTPPDGILKIDNEQILNLPVSRLTHKYLEII